MHIDNYELVALVEILPVYSKLPDEVETHLCKTYMRDEGYLELMRLVGT